MFSLDGLAHVQAHLHTVLRMIRQRLREPRYAVITVTQNFNSHTFVFLHKKRSNVNVRTHYCSWPIYLNQLHISVH